MVGLDYRPDAQVCWTVGGEFIYDLLAGRYMGLGMKSGRPANYVTGLSVCLRTITHRLTSVVSAVNRNRVTRLRGGSSDPPFFIACLG